MTKTKHNFILVVTFLVLTLLMAAPAFAGEYQTTIDAFTYGPYSVPAYDGDPSEEVNGNLPTFDSSELHADPYVYYGDLDSLGRCTTASSLLSQSLMPTWKRGSISSVYPSGWEQESYDVVPGKYLYNRCHLIGWQLAGADLTYLPKEELARDLITGTRYLNVGIGGTGMVGYENEVASYLKEDADNEVAYRVTPVFAEDNLVAYGVLMEGQSVASNDIEFCAFCYNVQPEIAIDYETGKSKLSAALPESKNIYNECEITVGEKTVIKNGVGKVGVTVRDGDKILQEGLDYELEWKWNKQPGQGVVTIVGIGSYSGYSKHYFIIVPAKAKIAKAKNNAAKSIRIQVVKQKGVSGYQYAWRVKGKTWKKSSVNKNVRIVKNLKKGKTYQVKVRVYKKINGKNWYGKWSTVKNVKVKK